MNALEISTLSIPRAVYDSLLEHVTGAVPEEAVGLLGGTPDGAVSCLAPLRNLAGERHFLANPRDQFDAMKRFKTLGIVPVAVYHSHPAGGVEMSADDLQHARRLPFIQVVVACAHPGRNPEAAAYRVTDSRPARIPLRILEAR